MKPRTYPVPAALVSSAHFGKSTTLDRIETVAAYPGDAGDWARRVLRRSQSQYLDQVVDQNQRLPRGLIAEDEDHVIVAGLINHQGQFWAGGTWVKHDPIPEDQLMDLTPEETSFVVRALAEDAVGVILSAATPLARLDHRVPPESITAAAKKKKDTPKGYPKLPDTAKIVAVVDELDKNAVLELIAVLSGGRVVRRHNGLWYPDRGWARTMRSVKPPPVVILNDDNQESVIAQVDEATSEDDFEETGVTASVTAATNSGSLSAALLHLEDRADEAFCQCVVNEAILAVGKDPTPGGRMPKDLRQYWLHGKGALKIRWGTPGAWTRCHRQLTKYMGPFRSKGACTNLSKHLGGPGVATHVGKG